ncbi:MAG: flagellar export protein FliJ [Nitrospinae bacterium]|nr:flagellar export protein FliJ [Nitrospinota bacterium]
MFRYRLQTLLRYRKTVEEEAQRSLGAANRHALAIAQRLGALEREREAKMDEKRARIGQIDNAAMLALYDNFFRGSSHDAWEERARKRQADEIVEMERQKLVEAMKGRKILESHRDLMKTRYDEDEQKKERMAADEMASVRFGRNLTS